MSEKPKFPHEMDSYKQLQQDQAVTAQNLLSFRERVFDFIVEDPAKTKDDLTLHFRRLKLAEYNDVIAKMNKLGIDQNNPTGTTKEQLDGMYGVECLALGYASADGQNAQNWLDLGDPYVVGVCFKYLLEISAPRENLSWFRLVSDRKEPSAAVSAVEQVPTRTSGDA